MVPLAETRRKVGHGVTLCGSFDPVSVLLQGGPEDVAAAAAANLTEGGAPDDRGRFILQPGCEVPPGTPIENLRAFCPG